MLLAAGAYRLRCAARYAICGGDFTAAWSLSRRAEELHATAPGRELALLCSLLAERL
jgi:hypothetical protein